MNIIITGASSGIGYSTAKSFAKDENNTIIAISRNREKLVHLASGSDPGKIIGVPLDLKQYDYTTLLTLLKENEIGNECN